MHSIGTRGARARRVARGPMHPIGTRGARGPMHSIGTRGARGPMHSIGTRGARVQWVRVQGLQGVQCIQ